MTYTYILSVLLALPAWKDGHGYPIRRPEAAARVIAEVTADSDEALRDAVTLDYLAAHESGYRTSAIGDGGKSCGPFQTPCDITPHTPLEQTRLALRILKQAETVCPAHPLWAYASGRCAPSRTALRYERDIAQALELLAF